MNGFMENFANLLTVIQGLHWGWQVFFGSFGSLCVGGGVGDAIRRYRIEKEIPQRKPHESRPTIFTLGALTWIVIGSICLCVFLYSLLS